VNKLKSIVRSLGMTKWFYMASWEYIVTRKFESKVEYATGIIPAWIKFTIATYGDFKKMDDEDVHSKER